MFTASYPARFLAEEAGKGFHARFRDLPEALTGGDSLAPKLALYVGMRERGMPNTELAARLGVSETVIRRMLNPRHDTKPARIQAALAILGKRIVVTFEDAA